MFPISILFECKDDGSGVDNCSQIITINKPTQQLHRADALSVAQATLSEH